APIFRFDTEEQAIAMANDTEFGLASYLYTRDLGRAWRMGRGIKAGRVWTNCYHLYPAHAAFGGYKKSGVG
ncbi:aldehyde dehydrogenase family protein, partial [Pseudomonas otitidis]